MFWLDHARFLSKSKFDLNPLKYITKMTEEENHPCLKCGRECKTKRGLAIHESKCGLEKETQCSYCNTKFSSPENLNRHRTVCKIFKAQKQEEDVNKRQIDLEARISILESEAEQKLKAQADHFSILVEQFKIDKRQDQLRHEGMMKMSEADRLKAIEERDLALKAQDEKERLNRDLLIRIRELERKNDIINHKMIQFAEKATEKNTTIYNNNPNFSTIQSATLQLQHFDASLFRDKIVPPFRMIYDVGQLVEQLHRFGLGNIYRSLDRSRNVVLWLDQDGKEVRDSNCSQIRETILVAMETDIRKQLEYQEQREAELEQREGSEHLDELIGVRANIVFCRNLLDRNGKVMKELQKELSKKAKNKKDTSVDTPKIVGYTAFLSSLEVVMFSYPREWIDKSIEEFGIWMADHLKDKIEVEGSVLYQEKKFVVISNDEGMTRMIYGPELFEMIQSVYLSYFGGKMELIYKSLIQDNTHIDYSQVEIMDKWMHEGEEEITHQFMSALTKRRFGR
jgi:hypothetical protein